MCPVPSCRAARTRVRAGAREECSFRVYPTVAARLGVISALSGAEEDRPRRAHGDEFVRIDRQIVPVHGTGVLQKVARHPVILIDPGHVLDDLAPIASMQFGAAFTGGADVGRPHPRVVGHRDNRRFAVPRVALDGDVLGVYRLVGLEIIDGAARAPGPGAQGAPIVELARLAFVAQADDAEGQPGAVIRLNAARVECGVAPAAGENLLLPRRPGGPATGSGHQRRGQARRPRWRRLE